MTDETAPGGLAAALARAQGEIKNPELDGENPHFRSRFATLAACLRAVRPVFSRHGLAVVQMPHSVEGGVAVTTVILHGDERIESTLSAACGRKVQETGSAITYLRRYALCSMCGIVGDDDDGEAATPRPDDRRFAAQRAACGELLRALGATTSAAGDRLIRKASDGTLGLGDVDEQPGEVLAVLHEWREIEEAE